MTALACNGRRAAALALSCCLVFVLGACAKSDVDVSGTKGEDIAEELDAKAPETMLGLKVQKENIADTLGKAERAFVDATVLYSVRTPDDLVQATLQVSRFNEDAAYKSGKFRRTVVARLGGSVPQVLRVGERDVYLSQGSKQKITSWFEGRNLYVLSVRDDFEQPRNLLREALELEL